MAARALLLAAVCLGAVVCGVSATTSFLSLGDWGDVTSAQENVIQAMTKTLRSANYSFLLGVGDNFYPRGVQSVSDSQWTSTYTSRYSDPAFNLPWLMTLGNHDHMPSNGGQAEIDWYTNGMDNRWYMPNYYYTRTFQLDNGQTLQVLFLDTILLCPQCTVKVLTGYVAEGAYTQPELEVYKSKMAHWEEMASAEWAWVNATLAASTADWLIACGHYPIYSGGEHGSQIELITQLEPVLQAYNLDAYINGHDHTLQHLQHNGLNFFVSGGGTYKGRYTAQPQSVWGEATQGYMTHSFPAVNQMVTTVYDQYGTVVHTATQQRRPKATDARPTAAVY